MVHFQSRDGTGCLETPGQNQVGKNLAEICWNHVVSFRVLCGEPPKWFCEWDNVMMNPWILRRIWPCFHTHIGWIYGINTWSRSSDWLTAKPPPKEFVRSEAPQTVSTNKHVRFTFYVFEGFCWMFYVWSLSCWKPCDSLVLATGFFLPTHKYSSKTCQEMDERHELGFPYLVSTSHPLKQKSSLGMIDRQKKKAR